MAEVIYQESETVAKTVRVPDAVLVERDRLLSDGCCIGCRAKIAKGAVVRRGLCNVCYRAFARYKKARKVTQSDLIREGKLLPISKGGRKPANSFTKELADR